MIRATAFCKGFARARDGATAIEYALIASLIFVVIVGAVGVLGENLSALFQSVSDGFPEAED